MAIFTVTTDRDTVDAQDGVLSLREAVAEANAGQGPATIRFAAELDGATVTLTQGQLVLAHDATIEGDADGDGQGVILAGGGDRLLRLDGAGTEASLHGLTLTGGTVTAGGQPVKNGTITFSHTEGNRDVFSAAVKDGKYETGDIPVGLTKVSVVMRMGNPAESGPAAKPAEGIGAGRALGGAEPPRRTDHPGRRPSTTAPAGSRPSGRGGGKTYSFIVHSTRLSDHASVRSDPWR